MSRHRIVRSMNYEDEFYDDDDEYSRSVEDSYCISPSTAAQFTWNREKNVNFAAYMGEGEVINEEEEEEDETEEDSSLSRHDSLSDSSQAARLKLSDVEKAQLNSCLEEARNILGESVPEAVMIDVIIRNGFNLETAVNQLLCQQDAPKPQREPRQRRNRSQDDIDNVELDNLLAEIQGLESSHSSVFSQDGLRFTSAVFQSEHEIEDSGAGDKLEVISNQLHDVSLGDKTLTSVYDKAKPELNQSISEQVKDRNSSKQTINQKHDIKSDGATLSKTSHTQQPVKISLADLAKNSSAKKASNSSKANQNIPSKYTGSSHSSGEGVENKSKPNQDSAVSLSDLVKQAHSEKGSKQSTAPTGEFGKSEQAKGKETGLSLAELARQHKTPSSSVKTSASHSPALTSNAQRAHDGMASLSALVAQHSAQKKGSSDKSTAVFDSHIANKKPSTPSGNSTVPLSIPPGDKSVPKSSLSDLAKAHAQTGKSSNISLSQLAAQHRQSTSPSASTSPMSAMQNLGKPSMSSLLKNLTLEESEAKSKSLSSGTTNTLSLSTSPSSGMPSGLSLSSCLKTTKTSSIKADNIKPAPFKSKHKEYFEEDSSSDAPYEPEVLPNPMFSRSASNADAALLSDASTLGIVLCCIKRKRKQTDSSVSDSQRPVKYPKFTCLAQVSNRKLYADCVLRDITPFNFSSPSPDDVVRNKQKQAFTRSDKEFVV